MDIHIKRIYDEPQEVDGYRVLVDRLWPRGISKERAQLDEWDKEIAPSTQLRTWWKHDHAHMEEFAERYVAELENSTQAQALLQRAKNQRDKNGSAGRLTLLYAAKDTYFNHARILKEYLDSLDSK